MSKSTVTMTVKQLQKVMDKNSDKIEKLNRKYKKLDKEYRKELLKIEAKMTKLRQKNHDLENPIAQQVETVKED